MHKQAHAPISQAQTHRCSTEQPTRTLSSDVPLFPCSLWSQWRDDEEERLTTATDVYSFGGILMEVLTDRMPWTGEKSKYAIYQKVIVERRKPPILEEANLPKKLVDLIDACHEFDPAARPGQEHTPHSGESPPRLSSSFSR